MQIDGATAVITGGCGTMGQAIGKSLAQHGANVVPWDLGASGSGEVACDIRSREDVVRAFETTEQAHGLPNILINAAGVSGGRAPWPEDATSADDWDGVLSSDEAWQAVLGVNVLGVISTSREFARRLSSRDLTGVIVNITSISGTQIPDPGLAAYATSKAAVNAITKISARAFGPLGIRVNAVAPGVMDSRMKVSGVGGGVPTVTPRFDPDRYERIRTATPLENRFVRATDIAAAVLSIVQTEFVTGQVLVVDGGLTLQSLS